MCKTVCLLFAAFCFAAGALAAVAGVSAESFIRQRLSPQPKELEIFEGMYVLDGDSAVHISVSSPLSDSQKLAVADIFRRYWRLSPALEFSEDAANANLGPEGSETEISSGGIKIRARDFSALRQALKTLRQFAEAERDGPGQVFALAKIRDFASLEFRGIHLCVFPETTLEELEKYVRLAEYYKFNYVVIEPWGVFPFESHPEFAYADRKIDRKGFKKIIDYCRGAGIVPIPQLSVLGHGSQSRHLSGKHAVLAAHPELANIYEPLGWCYCMSSERTGKILKDLVSELHEFYGNPPYFHIGCDEAYDMATCYKCRAQNPASLFVGHLDKFRKFLRSRGARPIIWHDMLLDREDPRWAGEVASGTRDTAKALGALGKDIVIADWQYGGAENGGGFNTPKHFKEAGFDVLVCPWESDSGISALAKTAKDEKLFGFLQTTWHHIYGNKRYASFFRRAGDAAWNGGRPPAGGKFADSALTLIPELSHVAGDMKASYSAAGTSLSQISKSISD